MNAQKQLELDARRYRFLRSIYKQDEPFACKRSLTVAVCDWAKKLDPDAHCNMWSSQELAGPDLDKEVDRQMKKSCQPKLKKSQP